MQRFSDNKLFKSLLESLDLSITKKLHNNRTSSVAVSQSGKVYKAGVIESDTNTFEISSEQAVLMLSAISNDYKVARIITLVESGEKNISPLVLKIIKDHSIRTGLDVHYTLIDKDRNIISDIKNIDGSLKTYRPEKIILSRINEKPSLYMVKQSKSTNKAKLLKGYAIKGLKKNFPLYDSASGYACAVLTSSGKVYFAGQYSSPDKRLGLHSEVNATLAALVNKEDKITHIGLVSTKYEDTPCHMCGNCRQFLTEMMNRTSSNPKIYLFAKDTNKKIETNLKDYLPSFWTSKNW